MSISSLLSVEALEVNSLKNDEFLVIVCPFRVAVIIVPFIAVTVKGRGSYGGVSLFTFGCATRTVSPILICDALKVRFLSAFSFIFAFDWLSAARISSSVGVALS